MKTFIKLSILFGLMASQGTGLAATFCVTNSAELITALNQASNNGQDDEIRLKPNVYNNASTGFTYHNDDSQDLVISGGWQGITAGSCVIQSAGAHNTVFNANQLTFNLIINMEQGGNLTVSDLGFVNGVALNPTGTGSSGTGLFIDALSAMSGSILIERNIFKDNQAMQVAALSAISGSGIITARNNVFEGNNSVGSAGNIWLNSYATGIYFINNTVISNSVDITGPSSFSGLEMILQDQASGMLVNNIFWGNAEADFLLRKTAGNTTGQIYVYNNNLQTGFGTFDEQSGNLSDDPQLHGSGVFAYVPSLSSPMINAGLPSPEFVVPGVFTTEWSYGSDDLILTSRVQDGQVDIGARESVAEQPIFKDGFDQGA